jgi:ABC-type transport system involved in multi-copper enzyme maturation permease subunit
MTALAFLIIPSISSLSMRQVAALSMTLSLSLISFILLLLSIFLGGTSIWKDMERRYTFSVLGLPIPRTSYLMGKFIGIAGFIILTTLLLGAASFLVVWYISGSYPPDRPIAWMNLFIAIIFDAQKYILLVAGAFLFSTISTSFFLPIFGSISLFFIGSATQPAYEYITSSTGRAFSPFFRKAVTLLYYLLPNFSAFDLKVNAIYGVNLSLPGLAMTSSYFFVYTALLLTLSSILFSRREIQ